jgi:hypothetical protein
MQLNPSSHSLPKLYMNYDNFFCLLPGHRLEVRPTKTKQGLRLGQSSSLPRLDDFRVLVDRYLHQDILLLQLKVCSASRVMLTLIAIVKQRRSSVIPITEFDDIAQLASLLCKFESCYESILSDYQLR